MYIYIYIYIYAHIYIYVCIMFSIKIILTCYGLTKHHLKNPCAGKSFVDYICLELKRNLPVFMLIKNETNLVFIQWKNQVFLFLLFFLQYVKNVLNS